MEVKKEIRRATSGGSKTLVVTPEPENVICSRSMCSLTDRRIRPLVLIGLHYMNAFLLSQQQADGSYSGPAPKCESLQRYRE